MHDVDASARPTLVASRSHNTFYFTHGNPWTLLSRFSDAWVQKTYRVEQMVAPRGGGFLFDTNGLHRGEVRGNRTRLAVVLEFHAHGKVKAILKNNNPCPSIKQSPRAMRNAHTSRWEYGVQGLPLFPPEPRGDGDAPVASRHFIIDGSRASKFHGRTPRSVGPRDNV